MEGKAIGQKNPIFSGWDIELPLGEHDRGGNLKSIDLISLISAASFGLPSMTSLQNGIDLKISTGLLYGLLTLWDSMLCSQWDICCCCDR
jgi:hypothetical protein